MKQDLDPKSLYRVSNISPGMQYELCRAARDAKVRKVLWNFSPSAVDQLCFETALPGNEGPVVEPAPPSVIAEKFKLIDYFTAMSNDYHHQQRQRKFEERLSGARQIPKRGFEVGSWVDVFDKNHVRVRTKIQGKTKCG